MEREFEKELAATVEASRESQGNGLDSDDENAVHWYHQAIQTKKKGASSANKAKKHASFPETTGTALELLVQ